MSQTPEERIEYWKRRINEHIISFTRPFPDLKKDILETVNHIEADETEIIKMITRIETDFQTLVIAVEQLKPITLKEKTVNVTDTALDTGEIQKGPINAKA